jgi:hypothetical protein
MQSWAKLLKQSGQPKWPRYRPKIALRVSPSRIRAKEFGNRFMDSQGSLQPNAGVRAATEPMEAGDPCPYCQREIDDETAARLRRFDEYVQSAAATEAAASAAALAATAAAIEGIRISDAAAVVNAIREYAEVGEPQARASQLATEYAVALRDRKEAVLAGINGRALCAAPSK